MAIAVGVWMFAFTNSTLEAPAARHEMIEWIGIVAIVVCILGRTWASLYIGGRKVEQFVVHGPYSVMRNPLYFFSILGAFGAGAQLGSIVAGAIFGVLAWLVFYFVIVQEEQLMAKRYGAAFERYVATVPRLLPNPRLWHDEPTLTIMPPRMIRTFVDAMVLLISVPVAELFEQLQNAGIL
ncbi:MAG: isoprenylcysteine carboxylmethyltransferase family protein, partial [Pseudorhodoplanes sp.]